MSSGMSSIPKTQREESHEYYKMLMELWPEIKNNLIIHKGGWAKEDEWYYLIFSEWIHSKKFAPKEIEHKQRFLSNVIGLYNKNTNIISDTNNDFINKTKTEINRILSKMTASKQIHLQTSPLMVNVLLLSYMSEHIDIDNGDQSEITFNNIKSWKMKWEETDLEYWIRSRLCTFERPGMPQLLSLEAKEQHPSISTIHDNTIEPSFEKSNPTWNVTKNSKNDEDKEPGYILNSFADKWKDKTLQEDLKTKYQIDVKHGLLYSMASFPYSQYSLFVPIHELGEKHLETYRDLLNNALQLIRKSEMPDSIITESQISKLLIQITRILKTISDEANLQIWKKHNDIVKETILETSRILSLIIIHLNWNSYHIIPMFSDLKWFLGDTYCYNLQEFEENFKATVPAHVKLHFYTLYNFLWKRIFKLTSHKKDDLDFQTACVLCTILDCWDARQLGYLLCKSPTAFDNRIAQILLSLQQNENESIIQGQSEPNHFPYNNFTVHPHNYPGMHQQQMQQQEMQRLQMHQQQMHQQQMHQQQMHQQQMQQEQMHQEQMHQQQMQQIFNATTISDAQSILQQVLSTSNDISDEIKRKLYGNYFYRAFKLEYPDMRERAGKIARMILDGLNDNEIQNLSLDTTALRQKFQEAINALEQHTQVSPDFPSENDTPNLPVDEHEKGKNKVDPVAQSEPQKGTYKNALGNFNTPPVQRPLRPPALAKSKSWNLFLELGVRKNITYSALSKIITQKIEDEKARISDKKAIGSKLPTEELYKQKNRLYALKFFFTEYFNMYQSNGDQGFPFLKDQISALYEQQKNKYMPTQTTASQTTWKLFDEIEVTHETDIATILKILDKKSAMLQNRMKQLKNQRKTEDNKIRIRQDRVQYNRYEALKSFFKKNFEKYKQNGDNSFSDNDVRNAYKQYMKSRLTSENFENWQKNYERFGCNMFDFMGDLDITIDEEINPYFV